MPRRALSCLRLKFVWIRLTGSKSHPPQTYWSLEWHAKEVSNLLEPSWVLAGTQDEVPNAGDYLRLELPGGSSALVVRGKDGKVSYTPDPPEQPIPPAPPTVHHEGSATVYFAV